MIRACLLATAAVAVSAPVTAAPARRAPAASSTLAASNPFAKPSTLPLQAPDFSQIKNSDYLPAILAGIAQQNAEVSVIADQTAAPTFDNTVVAMERSGTLLERANLAFSAVNGADTNDVLQATDTKTAPLLAAHNDFIYLNAKLFQRFKYLHDHQSELSLNPEQAKLLDVYYKQFLHSGAELSAAKQAQLKTFNTRLSTLQTSSTRSCSLRPRQLRCTSPMPLPWRDCPTSKWRPLNKRRPTARWPATSYRCRTPRNSRRWHP